MLRDRMSVSINHW